MRVQKMGRIALAGWMALALAGSAPAAPQRSVPERAQTRPAARQQVAKTSVEFQSERTDSWLCLYVSPFFCSNLYPSLGASAGNTTTTTSTVPDRSRR